ncbi:IS1595 family transposase [Spiroplasma ixodetis]|nr:IS1595 family transposase [Spiroplasma ixodetis]
MKSHDVQLKPPYYQNRSWCNGPVATELISKKLKQKVTAGWDFIALNGQHFSQIGTNYAVGGTFIEKVYGLEGLFLNKFSPDFSPHVLVEGIMKLNEFNNAFQTEQQCLAYIANLKENKCIRCFNFNLNTSDLKRMRCLKCNQTFSILTGTIFSRSQTSLTSWFYLIFRWINTKHGIPSTDIAKELGVTLKTAWRMTHKIRTRIAKQKPQFIVEGTVQIDEMYLSHMGFKKQGRSLVNKTLIVGIYQKTTNNLIVKVLKNAKSKNLLQFAKNHISSKCLVYTDSWKGYCDFKSVFTKHETVNHQDGYVSKIGVNTNQIESVWKHIRRTFKTHIKVAKHHVHLYAKEAAYKFNKIPSFETVILCLI